MGIREELIRSYADGTFLCAVYECARGERGNQEEVAREVAALHNEGLIDAIEVFGQLSRETPSVPDLLRTRSILNEALPRINAPVGPVMRCVLRVYRAAGQDGTAGFIVRAFGDFCECLASRPHDALIAVEARGSEFADLLPVVLAAGARFDGAAYLAHALRLCRCQNIDLRRNAVLAIGRLAAIGAITDADLALAALERSAAEETDDQLLGGIVSAAHGLLTRFRTREQSIKTLIDRVLAKGGETTLSVASGIFGLYTKDLPIDVVDTMLAHLVRVSPASKDALDNLDWGLYRLIHEGELERALGFLEKVLLARSDCLTMETFDAVAHEILSNKPLLSKVATRWFLRGDRALCSAVVSILGFHDQPLDIDPAEVRTVDARHLLFVARKAIGYLFSQEITAAAIVVSLMQLTDDEHALDALGKLLFDPLLVNYGGKARDHVVEQIPKVSAGAKSALGRALASVDGYLEALQAVGDLPGLHPPEAHREARSRYYGGLLAEASKKAEKESLILSLCGKSILLYGRKSIIYVQGAPEGSQRMEVPLHTFTSEHEIPRMAYLDPLGLEYMLRRFQSEKLSE